MKIKPKQTIILLLIITTLTILAACGGSSGNNNLNGTWTRQAGETAGFPSITFDGNTIAIPGITDTLGPAAAAMGISYVYAISGNQLIISTSTQGQNIEALRLSFTQDGNTITVDGVAYTR